MDTVVTSFCGVCLLLVAGKLLRSAVPLFQRLYLPASVVGGLLGLLLISLAGDYVPAKWHAGWSSFPGFLINIVFAALFIGAKIPGIRTIWRQAAPQLCMGQMLAWGQYVIGLSLTLLILIPVFGVNTAFGNLLEIGFQGGHGTVGGLTSTFEEFGWPEGIALGYTVATIGMILGITVGMVLVNLAARRGWVKNVRTFSDQSRHERLGVYPRGSQPHAGRQTVQSESIDSLALHIAAIGIAVLFGYILQQLMIFLNQFMPLMIQETRIFRSFPLFPLCLIGGLILQQLLVLTKLDSLISPVQIQRLGGASLDFLVVSAVASIRIDFVFAFALPLALISLGGLAWSVFMVLYVAPRLFADSWFERAIAEFGQSTGVTATGLLLLRTVDPENETPAAASFGYKQLLHEPIMGGGFWTSFALVLVFTRGIVPVLLVSIVGLLLWTAFSYSFIRRNKRQGDV